MLKIVKVFFAGLFMVGSCNIVATCTRCNKAHIRLQGRDAVVKRSKGWRPVSQDVKNKMTRSEQREHRMNNRRKKAIPVRKLRKKHVDEVKKEIQALSKKIDALESLLAHNKYATPYLA